MEGVTLVALLTHFFIHNAIPAEIKTLDFAAKGAAIAILRISIVALLIHIPVAVAAESNACCAEFRAGFGATGHTIRI